MFMRQADKRIPKLVGFVGVKWVGSVTLIAEKW